MPCMQKKTKELGSKSDLQTKKLLKYLGMGVGVAGACVVVWLMFRVSFTSILLSTESSNIN